jgi:hypothetical protein
VEHLAEHGQQILIRLGGGRLRGVTGHLARLRLFRV